ncbi:hypothetical protein ACFW2V_13645 [Streptomyces sp. NPDC058947]|uniref:hypothetical protein n=1 Tax=Streptomyces sp. NPDC058947 TaxID=3346675 RepID=UPI0036BC133E
MSSLYVKTAGDEPPVEAWWDPEHADAVFLMVQEGDLGMLDRDHAAEMIAAIWRGDLPERMWTTLLIMTNNMPFPVPCTVERDPKAADHTAVFRGADGVALYAMKI